MVIAHFMVGAQKKMVLGPAGWLRNARNEEVVAILFVIGSVCACLSFFLSKSVSGSRREKNEDKEREERFQSACDLFWCASRETRASVKSKDRAEKEQRVARKHAKARARFYIVTITKY